MATEHQQQNVCMPNLGCLKNSCLRNFCVASLRRAVKFAHAARSHRSRSSRKRTCFAKRRGTEEEEEPRSCQSTQHGKQYDTGLRVTRLAASSARGTFFFAHVCSVSGCERELTTQNPTCVTTHLAPTSAWPQRAARACQASGPGVYHTWPLERPFQ